MLEDILYHVACNATIKNNKVGVKVDTKSKLEVKVKTKSKSELRVETRSNYARLNL